MAELSLKENLEEKETFAPILTGDEIQEQEAEQETEQEVAQESDQADSEVLENVDPKNRKSTRKRIQKLVGQKNQGLEEIEILKNERVADRKRIQELEARQNANEYSQNIKNNEKKQKDLESDIKKYLDEGDNTKVSELISQALNKTIRQDDLDTVEKITNHFKSIAPWYETNDGMTVEAIGKHTQISKDPKYSSWSERDKLKLVKDWVEEKNAPKKNYGSPNVGVTNRVPDTDTPTISQIEIKQLRSIYKDKTDREIVKIHSENHNKFASRV